MNHSAPGVRKTVWPGGFSLLTDFSESFSPMNGLQEFLRNDDGASLVEYACIIMMTSIFALAALRSLGNKSTNVLTKVANQLS